jgi:hypothetical protein
VEWSRPASARRLIAVGDVHGDYEALVAILVERGLIDPKGKWIGGDAQLVLMGDLNDRGPATRRLMDFVMDLETKAAAAGGEVHTLIGNHEVLAIQGETRYLSREDMLDFTDFLPESERGQAKKLLAGKGRIDPYMKRSLGQGVVNAFRGDTKYAKWIRSRNTMVRIGDTLFVHAGLEEWAKVVDPAQLNATVRQWVSYMQGAGPRPDEKTEWVLGHSAEGGAPDPHIEGPLWTAIFSLAPNENRGRFLRDLPEILARLGVKRVVMGHIMTPDGKIMTTHPKYGDQVIMSDCAISRGYEDGSWGSVEIAEGKVTAHYAEKTPVAPPRKKGLLECIRELSGL